jgi:hypothetical protein
MPDPTQKIYLDYLDKEMSIMGILSTFCVAALALVLDKVVSAITGSNLAKVWENGHLYVIIGSASMLFASLFFYRQRSLLAWHYGQISLCIARSSEDIESWLRESDSWATWIHYRIAFGCLIVAFIEYGFALLSLKYLSVQKCPYTWAQLPVWAGIVVLAPWLWILSRYRYEDHPVKCFLDSFSQRGRTPGKGQRS